MSQKTKTQNRPSSQKRSPPIPIIEVDDQNTCVKCKKEVGEKDEGICCDLCDKWLHRICANLSVKEYEVMTEGKANLKWFCDACESTVIATMRLAKEIKESQTKLEEKVEALDKKHSLQDIKLNTENERINALESRLEKLENAKSSEVNRHTDQSNNPMITRNIYVLGDSNCSRIKKSIESSASKHEIYAEVITHSGAGTEKIKTELEKLIKSANIKEDESVILHVGANDMARAEAKKTLKNLSDSIHLAKENKINIAICDIPERGKPGSQSWCRSVAVNKEIEIICAKEKVTFINSFAETNKIFRGKTFGGDFIHYSPPAAEYVAKTIINRFLCQ